MTDADTAFPVVPLAAFEACDFEEPIARLTTIDMLTLSMAFRGAAQAPGSPHRAVYELLAAITEIHLNPGDTGRHWLPSWEAGSRRTMIPSDIRGEQTDILAQILDRVIHPALRARLADIVWSNDRKNSAAAQIAIASYGECVHDLIRGTFTSADGLEEFRLGEAERPAHRALQITSATKKRKDPLPPEVVAILTALYQQNLADSQVAQFGRVAQLCIDYRILDAAQVAPDLEIVAANRPGIYPMAICGALDYAAQLYRRVGNAAADERCALGSVKQLLRMRDEVSQAGAKAAWVMDALQRLRHIQSEEAIALDAELEDELARLQRASLREIKSFSVDIVHPDRVDEVTEQFSAMDLSTALKDFVMLGKATATAELKAQALDLAKGSILASSMSTRYLDDRGRTVSVAPGAGRGDPPEDWFLIWICRIESMRRSALVANSIEPARITINRAVSIEERHLNPIVWQSPFVPEDQAAIWALGLARFFQGDMVSAAHLLIPRLEPSLRHILRAHGAEPAKRRDDATEEDRSLDAIIINHRQELITILGEPILEEVERLFNNKLGPALRHDIAHGQIAYTSCYTADVVYACWLLYRLCSLFIYKAWDELVRPALAGEETALHPEKAAANVDAPSLPDHSAGTE